MISPVGIASYVRAEQGINQAYINVLDKLRPEFFNTTQLDKEISINFTLLDNGTNPRSIYILFVNYVSFSQLRQFMEME